MRSDYVYQSYYTNGSLQTYHGLNKNLVNDNLEYFINNRSYVKTYYFDNYGSVPNLGDSSIPKLSNDYDLCVSLLNDSCLLNYVKDCGGFNHDYNYFINKYNSEVLWFNKEFNVRYDVLDKGYNIKNIKNNLIKIKNFLY